MRVPICNFAPIRGVGFVISARTAIGARSINVIFETVATKPTFWEAVRASATING
jgi:hypothetical protein